jgi:hypothetical protein
LATLLKQNGDINGAIDVYSKYPIVNSSKSFEDAFIYGELVTILMKNKLYDDSRLSKYLILWAERMGVPVITSHMDTLDKANKTKVCKEVYSGVHKKPMDDPDLVTFFKFKGW